MTRTQGNHFEDRAVEYLLAAGWEILERNYRDGPREIDVVARQGDLVAFFEVKGRTSLEHGHPLESIGRRKRRDVGRAAARWIRENRLGPVAFRFDALGLTRILGIWDVYHVRDAWRLGE